jgi:hypothetical protein
MGNTWVNEDILDGTVTTGIGGRIAGMGGIAAGGIGLTWFNIKKWLKNINYPDPIGNW